MKKGLVLLCFLVSISLTFAVAEEFISPVDSFAKNVYSSTYSADKAHDGNTNTGWFTKANTKANPAFPAVIDLDFGKEVILGAIDLYALSSYVPMVINVYVSIDNENWDINLPIIVNANIENKDQYNRLDFDSAVNLRYLRIEETSNAKMSYGGAIYEVRGIVGEEEVGCVDSDGGKNYYERGTTIRGDGRNGTDSCINSETVLEWFCLDKYNYNNHGWACPNGCLDGACVHSFDFGAMSEIEGIFSPREEITMLVTGEELFDSSSTTPEEGFNVQYYVHHYPIVDGETTVTGGNAQYNQNSGVWEVVFNAPEESGDYQLDISLYCSRDDAVCAKRYGQAAQISREFVFTVLDDTQCASKEDCPSIELEPYCATETTLCSSVTFYICIENQCVASGGGGGCGPCENGCKDNACIEEEFEFRNLNSCGDFKEFIKNPYDFKFVSEYEDDLEWEFNSKDSYSGTLYINGKSYDFDNSYSSFSYFGEDFYAHFSYDVMEYGDDISNEDLRDIFEDNVRSGICSARTVGGGDGVYYFCDYSLWDFDDVGYDSENREQGVVYWLSSTDNEFITSELEDGLVSYYNLDETSGIIATDVHGSNDGISNNGVTINQAGKIDKSYSLDGSNDYVDLGSLEDVLDKESGSVSFWMNPDDISKESFPFQHFTSGNVNGGNDRLFFVLNSGRLMFAYMNNPVAEWADIPNADKWYHVVGTWENETWKLYVDGSLEVSQTGATVIPFSSSEYNLGRGWDSTRYFNGKIDEVGIWDKALSPDEISDLYNNGNGLTYNAFPKTNNIFSINVYYDYYNSGRNSETYEEYLLNRINDKLNEVRGNQESSLDFLSKLKDNRGTSIDPMRFYNLMPGNLKKLLDFDLELCSSELDSSEGECDSYWQCTLDPLICPPHGEQKRTCVDSNNCFDRQEVTQQCNPGICSGCSIPRWFQYEGLDSGENYVDNICIPYGARFAVRNGWSIEEIISTEEGSESLTVAESETEEGLTLVIYNDNTATFDWVMGDKNASFDLVIGGKYDVLELFGGFIDENILSFTMIVDDIYYNPNNYESSYINVTFFISEVRNIERPDFLNMYCDYDGDIETQRIKGYSGAPASCQNNFECESNFCSSGECIEITELIDEARGFKKLGVRILCQFSEWFGFQEYDECILENLG